MPTAEPGAASPAGRGQHWRSRTRRQGKEPFGGQARLQSRGAAWSLPNVEQGRCSQGSANRMPAGNERRATL